MDERLLTGLVLYALGSVWGLALVHTGLSGRRETALRYERERSRATGEVVGLVRRNKRFGKTRAEYWYAEIAFRAEGRDYRLECPDGLWKDTVSEGDRVELLYGPDDPSRFHLESYGELEDKGDRLSIRLGAAWLLIWAAVCVFLAHVIDV